MPAVGGTPVFGVTEPASSSRPPILRTTDRVLEALRRRLERLRPELDANDAVLEVELVATIGKDRGGRRRVIRSSARLRWQYDEDDAD